MYPQKIKVEGILDPIGANGIYTFTESYPANLYAKGSLIAPPSVYEYGFYPQLSGETSARWRLLAAIDMEFVILYVSQYFDGTLDDLPPPNDDAMIWTQEEGIGYISVTEYILSGALIPLIESMYEEW